MEQHEQKVRSTAELISTAATRSLLLITTVAAAGAAIAFSAVPQLWEYPVAKLQFANLGQSLLVKSAYLLALYLLMELAFTFRLQRNSMLQAWIALILAFGIIYAAWGGSTISETAPCLYQNLPECFQKAQPMENPAPT